MIEIRSRADLTLLRESVELECKLAAGRDGQGALPDDFWPTYSAFANTAGGVVLLGVREMTGLHPFDATRLLQEAVEQGLLESHNPGRGAVYCLPGAGIPTPEEVFGASSEQSMPSSAHLTGSSAHLAGNTPHTAEERDADGCLLSDQLDVPVIDSLSRLRPEFRASLEKLASAPRTKGKMSAEDMRTVLLALCKGHFVALGSLAELVNRDPDALRQQHLNPLAKSGKLRLAFPTAPTHARQAYRAAE